MTKRPVLTDEQRQEIRNRRAVAADGQSVRRDRRYRREQRKRLKRAASMHGLGRQPARYSTGGRKVKPMTKARARHFGVTWTLAAGDLAILSKDTWLRSETSSIRRTLPQGSLVVIDSMHESGLSADDFKRNKCRIFFDGHIWDYMPIGHLRPIADYDGDDDDEEDEE